MCTRVKNEKNDDAKGVRSQRGQNTTTRDKMAGDRGAAALARGYLSHPIAPSSAGGNEEPRGEKRRRW